jgi:hypothetical protein
VAKYYSYSRDASLLLDHFDKTAAVVAWLNASRELSLSFPRADPRYGIPMGDSEADNFVRVEGEGHFSPPTAPLHYYASAAATSRAFLELGRVWADIGKAAKNEAMTVLAVQMLQTSKVDGHGSLSFSACRQKQLCVLQDSLVTHSLVHSFRISGPTWRLR